MAVAKADIETIKCVVGTSNWELCTKLKNLRRELERLELVVDKLLGEKLL